jgi:desumoylating isopeptidase 1
MADKVTLLVYDITQGMAKNMSMMFLGQQVDCVYHTSLVVYGKEYFFGGGICQMEPKQTPYGQPVEEHPIGETEIPKEVFDDYLKDLEHKYTPEKYDLIEHNCNMFTAEAAEFLTGKPVDKKYSTQAKELLETPAGQMFKPFLQQMQGAVQNPQPGFYY